MAVAVVVIVVVVVVVVVLPLLARRFDTERRPETPPRVVERGVVVADFAAGDGVATAAAALSWLTLYRKQRTENVEIFIFFMEPTQQQ